MIDNLLVLAWHLLGTCLALAWYLVGTWLVLGWYLLGCIEAEFLIAFSLMFEALGMHREAFDTAFVLR